MIRLRKFAKGERGAVAVEFALFFPLLALMLFAIVEMGGAWYSRQMIVNASREGARMGSMYGDTTDAQVVSEVTQILQQAGFPGTVAVNSTGASGSTGALVTVTVTSNYQFPVLSSLVPESLATVQMQASTVMRHE